MNNTVYNKDKSYGSFLNIIIHVGDLFIINFFFLILYFLAASSNNFVTIDHDKEITIFLLINLCYFITSTFIHVDVASNIIYFDKLIQKSFYFILLYVILLTGSSALLHINNMALINWLLCAITLIVLFILWHAVVRILLKNYRGKGYNYKKVVIIGSGSNAEAIYKEINNSVYGFKVLGYFDEIKKENARLPQYLGNIKQLKEFYGDPGEHKIDEIYCALPGTEDYEIVQLTNFCEKNMIRFYLVPDFFRYVKRKLTLRFFNTVPVLNFRFEPLQFTYNRVIKRAFDICFSLIILCTVFPLFYIIFGTIIKMTSKGPILFKQKRTGFRGDAFDCYKFRSMRPNAIADKQSASKGDPRITRVGAFMRKTSIDEFPQFINVLKGDMSIVGPRPHMLKHTEEYSAMIDKFMVRHLIRPGITGWAQVNGYRGEIETKVDMEERVKMDVWYIENWSFFLDLKIIFLTVWNVFKGEKKAY